MRVNVCTAVSFGKVSHLTKQRFRCQSYLMAVNIIMLLLHKHFLTPSSILPCSQGCGLSAGNLGTWDLCSAQQASPLGAGRLVFPTGEHPVHTPSRNTSSSKTALACGQVRKHISEYYNGNFHWGRKKSPSNFSLRINRERKNERVFTAVLKLLK